MRHFTGTVYNWGFYAASASVLLFNGVSLAQSAERWAAKVDGEPVLEREVQRELDRVLAGREADAAARQALYQATVQQLVGRRLILNYLAANKLGASQQDLDLALRRIEKQLQLEEVTLDKYLQQTDQSPDELRQTLAWQIGWKRYLDKYLTDQNLERYFNDHRRDFDGTEIRVAQILFKVDPADDVQALAAAVKQAEQVAAEIKSGQIQFEAAAERFSQSPSAANGGDIGLIRRREPQPEPFSQAAFALDQGQISPPVVTPFGVHLIRCLEIKPGTKTWQQVRVPLERAVTEYLFRWVADQQRPHSTVELSGR